MKIQNKESSNIHSLLICLSNIKELRNYIPKKKDKNDFSFLLNFFAVLRIVKKNNEEFLKKIKYDNIILQKYDEIYTIFLTQIQDLSIKGNKNINIFDNFNVLIQKIILELQKELYRSETNKDFDFDNTMLYANEKIQNNNERTLIQNLFFFEIEITKKNCKCSKNKFYQLKYYIEFELNKKDDNSLSIISLFNKLSETGTCNKCGMKLEIIRKFISLPKYLIIVVNNLKKNVTTFLDEAIDIRKFCNFQVKKAEYELISFIDENIYPIIKTDYKWISYDSKFIDLNLERKIPNLLIYKKEEQKKYNIKI